MKPLRLFTGLLFLLVVGQMKGFCQEEKLYKAVVLDSLEKNTG